MLTICICDDDKTITDELTLLVYSTLKDYPAQIIYLYSGESFLFHFLEKTNFVDIILMDVDMGKFNGIEVMKKMRQAGCNSELIYLTAMKDFVFDSFETFPLNYILKDEKNVKKLQSVLLIAAENAMKKKNNFITIGSSKNAVKVDRTHILFIESYNRQVLYHLLNHPPVESSSTLLQAFGTVGREDFVRTHKSYIVNLHNIRQIKPSFVTLIDGTQLPIGRKFVNDVREKFSDFLAKNTIDI